MDSDEIELSLRRFASQENNKALSKLLDSLFTAPVAEDEKEEKEKDDGKE